MKFLPTHTILGMVKNIASFTAPKVKCVGVRTDTSLKTSKNVTFGDILYVEKRV